MAPDLNTFIERIERDKRIDHPILRCVITRKHVRRRCAQLGKIEARSETEGAIGGKALRQPVLGRRRQKRPSRSSPPPAALTLNLMLALRRNATGLDRHTQHHRGPRCRQRRRRRPWCPGAMPGPTTDIPTRIALVGTQSKLQRCGPCGRRAQS